MTKRPNFLVILADDLGFSDIGCFGAEIRTPNIDRIFKEGCRFTDFHATAACSPTRAILLSGTDAHIAGVGCMSEQKASGGERWNVKGHEGYLNHDVAALPELLQEAGYHTLLSGKWHLGLKPENNPHARGFDRSLALLPGCSNHYGWEPQFGSNSNAFFDRIPPLYTRDGKREIIKPNTSHLPEGFYSSDAYAKNMIDYLKAWQDGQETGDQKPFFAYLPFTAPHWPLQCSEEDRDAYKGFYDDGPDALRDSRLKALQRECIYTKEVQPAEVIAPEVTEWDDMNAEERRLSSRSMETYAGMVTAMDRAIGDVLNHLEEIGQLDSTFVMFMSDNGAEGAAYEAIPVMGNSLMQVINRFYDNSFDNIGNADSFVWYGPRWAQAATAPHRLYKMYSTEGGLRVPMKKDGATLRAFATVADLCPTILELAGVAHPVPAGETTGKWRGRTVAAMRGKSWVSYLEDGKDGMNLIHLEDDPAVGWELFGRAALRKGKWKILHVGPAAGGRQDGKWQLYDMTTDAGETEDLSETHPSVMREMLAAWDQYVDETGTIWGDDKIPIGGKDRGWDAVPNDVIGGDAMEQTRAWMRIGKNMTPDYLKRLDAPRAGEV